MEIALFIAGGVISWIISYYYYAKSDSHTPQWFSVSTIKELLTKNPSDVDWTAQQIVKLYKSKVLDRSSTDPLPFNFCPECGSKRLKRSQQTDYNQDESYFIINCQDCKWGDWTQ